MVKNGQLLDEVFKLYKSRRDYAEHKAFELRERLMQNQAYSDLHYQIKNLNLDIAKLNFDGKADEAKALEQKRNELQAKKLKLLSELKIDESELSPVYSCPVCSDSGYLPQGGVCKCFYKTLSAVSQSVLGLETPVLPTFDMLKCANEREKKLKAKLIEYCNKFPPETAKNLIFTGATGTGKTFTAGAIANELSQRDYSVIYLSATKLNDVFRLYHVTDDANKRAIFDLLCDSDLLVIDDLGTEPLFKNVTVVYLTAIISERLASQRPFIITTNLSMEEIGLRYNDRLLSRLSDESSLRISFIGDDKRRKK